MSSIFFSSTAILPHDNPHDNFFVFLGGSWTRLMAFPFILVGKDDLKVFCVTTAVMAQIELVSQDIAATWMSGPILDTPDSRGDCASTYPAELRVTCVRAGTPHLLWDF